MSKNWSTFETMDSITRHANHYQMSASNGLEEMNYSICEPHLRLRTHHLKTLHDKSPDSFSWLIVHSIRRCSGNSSRSFEIIEKLGKPVQFHLLVSDVVHPL